MKMATTKRWILLAGLLLIIAGASAPQAQTIRTQGTAPVGVAPRGDPVSVAGVDVSGNVKAMPADAAGQKGDFRTQGAPAFNLSCSGVSAATTGLTSSARYRVACTGAVFIRTGTGTPTAVTTDAPIFGPAVEVVALDSTATAIACITAAGTATCTGTLLKSSP